MTDLSEQSQPSGLDALGWADPTLGTRPNDLSVPIVLPPLTVGIDVGGTKCLALALDARAVVVATKRVATPRGGQALAETLASVTRDLARIGDLRGLGVGAPGLVDADGVLRFAPNLSKVRDLPLRAELEARLRLPVFVDNDATCATWGERQAGAGAGADHLVLVTLGTGIGGGLVTGGRLNRGAHGFAGEIGHMVIDPYGPPCPCGRRGCWERFASGSGLGRLAREAAHAGQASLVVELAGGDPEDVRGEHVTLAAAQGDHEAAAVLAEFAGWLALGLANLANILDPQLFVLGGGLVAAGEVLLQPTRAAFASVFEAGGNRPSTPIVAAKLGDRAGAVGAAYLARGH